MLWLVTTYWGVGVQTLIFIVVIVVLFFIGGFPLLFSRYVLTAIVAAAIIIAGESYVAQLRLGWIDQGRTEERAKWEDAKRAADAERDSAIAAQRANSEVQVGELEQRLAKAVRERDIARKGLTHVSKDADSRCTIPLGFVRDHDTALPGAGEKSAVPNGPTADDNPSGIPLSVVRDEVAFNYAQCAKAIDAYNAENERRYNECVAWDKRWGTQSGCAR